MSDYEIRFQAERSSYETQIMQMKHKIAELEATVLDLTKEVERLNGLYTETKKQAEAFKNRYGSLDQSSVGELDMLRRENDQLRKTIWVKFQERIKINFFRKEMKAMLDLKLRKQIMKIKLIN